MPGMTWNSEAEAKLLLAIMAFLGANTLKLDYAFLAERMGPDCTPEAVRQHLGKLKKQTTKSSEGGASATTPDKASLSNPTCPNANALSGGAKSKSVGSSKGAGRGSAAKAKSTKASPNKKQRTGRGSKAKAAPETPSGSEGTDDGNLGDEEATPGSTSMYYQICSAVRGEAKAMQDLAKAILGEKRKFGEMDDAVKQETYDDEGYEGMEEDGDSQSG